jgi:DNA invertase Pin-like site-specific DNA recombinase
MMPTADKITPRQYERRAYVYVRQSTPQQVQHHRESQVNQDALVQRAQGLCWPPERVHVIDSDLGHSGQDGQRPGFQELVAAVSLRHVGIILAYEASRLARNNADWYMLLDLAAVVGTLIADTEGVYDPRNANDRLLLGLRGLLSAAELHLLRLRMEGGRLRQVERGTYRQGLPTGLARRADGCVDKDPDRQIQRTLELVFARFARFAALGSAQKVLRSFRDDGVLWPRRQRGGPFQGQVRWRKPTASALIEILRNPAYAGAFADGRKGPHPDRRPGQLRSAARPLEEWTSLHHDVYPADVYPADVYPAYVSWEQYMANRARLADNASAFARRARAAPRDGAALLAGLVVCGRCGYQMHVVYKPRRRDACVALAAAYGAATCLHIDGARLDAAVVDAFFTALAPAELHVLDVLEEALALQHADRDRLTHHHTDQVARAEYEARLAERQYHAIDPENRLVAAELERRWEVALRAVVEAREAAERFAQQLPEPTLEPGLAAQLRDVGRSLPELWASGRLTPAQQKELLRSLIRRVIVTRPVPDTLEARIVWVSGAVTPLTLRPPIQHKEAVADYDVFVARVLELGAAGYPDPEIARRLTQEGFRSARRPYISADLVAESRRARGQLSLTEQFKTQATIDGQWTVCGLAQALAVHRNWLYARIRRRQIPTTRHPVLGHYLVPDDPDLLARLRAQRDRCGYR